MVWIFVIANLIIFGCSIFWFVEACKALSRAREIAERAVILSNLMRQVIELSDETVSSVEEPTIDHEEDC